MNQMWRKLKICFTIVCLQIMLKGATANKTEDQPANIIQTDLKFKRNVFVSFDTCKNFLGDFYFKKLKIITYHELASILKLLITLTCDQASIERGLCVLITSNNLFEMIEYRIFLKLKSLS